MSSSAAVSSSSPDRLALEIRKASQAQRQAEQRVEILQKELAASRKELDTARAAIAKRADARALHEALSQVEDMQTTMQMINADRRKEVEANNAVRQEVEQLRVELQECRKQKEELLSQQHVVEGGAPSGAGPVDPQAQQDLLAAQEEVKALVEELNAVKQSKADLLRELSKARAESKNAGETLTDREHQLSSLTDNLNKQIKKTERVDRDLRSLTKEHERSTASFIEQIEELRRRAEEAETQVEQLAVVRENLSTTQSLLRDREQETERLERRVAELEASSTEVPALQRQVQEQGNRVTELETKLGETTSSLETSQEELRVFRERVETLSAERDSLLQSQTELQTTLSKARQSLEETTLDAHHKKSTLEQLNATLESTQASLEDARSQLQAVQERLSQVSKQREEGLQREADDQEELTQLRAEVEALNEEGASMLLHQCAEVAILEALLRHYADGHAQTSLELQTVRSSLVEQQQKAAALQEQVEEVQSRADVRLAHQQRLVKELQAQLAKEVENRKKSSPKQGAGPALVTRPRGRSMSGSNSRGSPVASGGGEDERSVLIQENNVLVKRVGEMQTEKWHLQEQLDRLQGALSAAHAELDKKTQLVDHYVAKEAHHVSSPQQRGDPSASSSSSSSSSSKQGLLSRLFNRKSPKQSEMDLIRLQTLYEESSLQIIHLQDNMNTLGDEVERLSREVQCLEQERNSLQADLALMRAMRDPS